MKNALHRGDVRTLNVYTVGFNSDEARGLLGYSTFPASYSWYPKDDGVVIHYASLPKGSAAPFNMGRVLTHEVGHWVGLYHTFDGGCDGRGDYVDDTPAEASPASGCPVGRDTCPSTGLDREQAFAFLPKNLIIHIVFLPAIHNHMDYSVDGCRDNFTPGQVTRFKGQLRAFRKIYLWTSLVTYDMCP